MVVIVGGSVSGLVAALKLSKLSIPCIVIDREQSPGDKACGEGLSSLGVKLFSELGFDWSMLSGHCSEIDHYELVSLSGEVFCLPVPGVSDTSHKALGVNRRIFEAVLRDFVRSQPGVTLRLGESVRSLNSSGTGVEIITDRERLFADHLILASGGADRLLAERVIPKANLLGATRWFKAEMSSNFSGIIAAPIPEGELFATRSSPHRLNLSILSKSKDAARQWGSEVSVDTLSDFVSPFGIKLLEEEDRSGAGIYVGRKNTSSLPPGVLAVGDAIEVLDPIGGMGMSHAILSANLAAEAVISCIKSGNSKSASASQYLVERERRTRPLRNFTTATRVLLRESSERVRHGLLKLCAGFVPSFRLN
jgi:flavin-dependent dehydrogenase